MTQILRKENYSETKYKIFGTSIDYLIENKNLDVPNYLKIDVDGIEHKILQGASKLLSSDKAYILIEINEII